MYVYNSTHEPFRAFGSATSSSSYQTLFARTHSVGCCHFYQPPVLSTFPQKPENDEQYERVSYRNCSDIRAKWTHSVLYFLPLNF